MTHSSLPCTSVAAPPSASTALGFACAHSPAPLLGSGVALLLLLALFPVPTGAAGGGFHFRKVALSGDSVPGVPGDQHFTWFGVGPFTTDASPRIDRQGNITFVGGWTNQADPHGIFRETIADGILDKVAAAGDEAPGVGHVFTGFPSFVPSSPELSEGRASFTGSFIQDGTELGVWDDRFGSLELVLRQREQPPGAPPGSTFFQWVQAMRGAGHIIVNARYSQAGGSEINDHGIWRDNAGHLELVALARTQAPGVPDGIVFGNGSAIQLPAFESWDLDEQGRIAFHARLMGSQIDELNDEGVWLEDEGGLQLFVREGDEAPGTGRPGSRFLGNFGFRTFDHSEVAGVVMNDALHIAFGARVDVPGASDIANTLYSNRSGSLELIALARFPGADPPGDPAPGFPEGGTFTRFLDGRINNLDQVFFSAMVDTGGDFFDQVTGIWRDRTGDLELVVRSGQAVPDLEPGTVFGVSQIVNLLDSGHLILFSEISGPGGDHLGLFVMDPDGSIRTVVHTGQLFSVRPGEQRRVAQITTGLGLGPDVAFVMDLRFQDGSEGIFEARRADPAEAPGQDAAALEDGWALRFLPGGANPAGSVATLRYEVRVPSTLSLDIFDASGRRASSLFKRQHVAPGTYSVPWAVTADAGGRLKAGVYFARLEGGGHEAIQKLVLLP